MWRTKERLRKPPLWIVVLLSAALVGQLMWGSRQSPPVAKAEELMAPPSLNMLRLATLGDSIALAKILMLWLQNFDNQPGLAIPFRRLNYPLLEKWLQTILILDPKSDYPLHAALRFYASIPDEIKVRRMLLFIHDRFQEDASRWRWLAFGAVIARHRLNDSTLALKFLNDIADKVDEGSLPQWVRGVHFSVLQEMGELKSARLIIGGLLHNKEITDPGELKFLSDWLKALESDKDSVRVE